MCSIQHVLGKTSLIHLESSYLVALGGVHTEDAMERVGRVITFLPHQPMMRVAVVSCDRPERYQGTTREEPQ